MNNNDRNLTARLRDKTTQESAFRELARDYGKPLYWHIRRIVVGHDDAEDALQNTFISIYRHIDKLADAEHLKAWVYRIATREALQILRRHTGLFQSIDTLEPVLTERLLAETSVDSEAAEVLFQQALLKLPTQQRIAFNMRYYDELSYEEIAEVTGKSVATLKTNYHYAVAKIKEYIHENT